MRREDRVRIVKVAKPKDVEIVAALLNAVCVDVNWRLAAPEVEFIVNDAQAKVFVVGPEGLVVSAPRWVTKIDTAALCAMSFLSSIVGSVGVSLMNSTPRDSSARSQSSWPCRACGRSSIPA